MDYNQVELWSGRPAKVKQVIGVAPVWGRPRRLRCLCQSKLAGKYAEIVILYFLVYYSYLSMERGWHFMPFGHPRGLPESVGSRDAWRACGPSSGRYWPARAWRWATPRGIIPRIRGGHVCKMRCWSGEVSGLILVKDKDESWHGD